MDKHTLKRIFHFGTASVVSMLITSNALAAEAGTGDALLQQIADNTANTLQKVNDLPAYLATLGQFIAAWITPDDSDTTANMQSNFSQLGNLLIQDQTTQNSLQAQLNNDLLTGTTKTTLPNANDLVYSTILGSPFYNPDPRGSSVVPQYNYIKNASGLTLQHILPSPGWRGTKDNQIKYINYYNTVMAIQSYGGYILSNHYADGNQLNTLQTTLITQASDPDAWFTHVASENIGWVLRQILMYQSQSFVLLTQLVQTQKQMVAAQVMTNAAVIASGNAEMYMIQNAQGGIG